MKLRNLKTNKIFEASLEEWKTKISPKENYHIIDWGNLVVLTKKENYGNHKDIKLMDKSEAQKLVILDNIYSFRDSTLDDYSYIRIKYFIAEGYEDGMTFDKFYDKVGRKYITRDFAKKILIELYSEVLIPSLPESLQALQDRQGNQSPEKKEEAIPKTSIQNLTSSRIKKVNISSLIKRIDYKWVIGTFIGAGILYTAYRTAKHNGIDLFPFLN